MPLAEASAEFGFITRLDVQVREFRASAIGSARIAIVHVADALDKEVSIGEVLALDEGGLAMLEPTFFTKDALRDEYQNGVGMDVLYVERLELEVPWRVSARRAIATGTASPRRWRSRRSTSERRSSPPVCGTTTSGDDRNPPEDFATGVFLATALPYRGNRQMPTPRARHA
jgi:hypothetical protein